LLFQANCFYEGYPELRRELSAEWEEDNRFYGIFLAMDHNYRIYESRDYRLYLTASVRATQVFDYLRLSDPPANRVIPELTLGVAIDFGGNRRGRF